MGKLVRAYLVRPLHIKGRTLDLQKCEMGIWKNSTILQVGVILSKHQKGRLEGGFLFVRTLHSFDSELLRLHIQPFLDAHVFPFPH